MRTITVYQIQAEGLRAFVGGGTKIIRSALLYTAPPSEAEKSAFLERCFKCDGPKDLCSIDPDHDVKISVLEMDLQDNGAVL